MKNMQYVLFSPSRNAYVAIDDTNRTTLTTRKDLANRFSKESAAANYLKFNVASQLGAFKIVAVSDTNMQELVEVANESTGGSVAFKTLLDELTAQVENYEMQIIDLYHYVGNNSKLPAHKGYKIYKKLAKLVQDRAKVKAQMKAIEAAMDFKYVPYSPRTDLYKELENM